MRADADLVALEVALPLHQRELDAQQLVEDQPSPRRLDVGHRLGLVDPVEGLVATLETETCRDPDGTGSAMPRAPAAAEDLAHQLRRAPRW